MLKRSVNMDEELDEVIEYFLNKDRFTEEQIENFKERMKELG